MATTNDTQDNTIKRGLGSPNMSQKKKDQIHHDGGVASAKSKNGAAGDTDAARRGGENSHKGSNS